MAPAGKLDTIQAVSEIKPDVIRIIAFKFKWEEALVEHARIYGDRQRIGWARLEFP
jgi:hypothetical protein